MENENELRNSNSQQPQEEKVHSCIRKKSIKQMYEDGEIVSLDEFAAEWMRQLELRFKNTSDNSEFFV